MIGTVILFMIHAMISISFVVFHIIKNAENINSYLWIYILFFTSLMMILFILVSAEYGLLSKFRKQWAVLYYRTDRYDLKDNLKFKHAKQLADVYKNNDEYQDVHIIRIIR